MVTKFSQISNSSANFGSGDFLLGVRGGTLDVLYTPNQVKQGVDPEISSDTNFYVASSGSDVPGNGSSVAPWATLQYAYNNVSGFELRGFRANIQILSSGTYVGVNMSTPNPSGSIAITGSSSSPSNIIITPTTNRCFLMNANNDVDIFYLTCQGNGSSAGEYGILATGQALTVPDIFQPPTVTLTGVSYSNLFIHTSFQSRIRAVIAGSWTVTGNANKVIEVVDSYLALRGSSCTVVGSPAWAYAFYAGFGESFTTNYSADSVFTGAATGLRFKLLDNSNVQTATTSSSGGLNYFPGDTTGTLGLGSRFDQAWSNAGGLVVANLPPSPMVTTGSRSFAIDSTVTFVSSNLGLIVAGGGGNGVPVYFDGGNWKIG